MKLKTKARTTINILLSKTQLGHIKWKHIYRDNLYYEPNKEKYSLKYKVTENKVIDILLTKLRFLNEDGNYFISFHYKTKPISTYYYQDLDIIYDLFVSVKFSSLTKSDKSFFLDHILINCEWVKHVTDNIITYSTIFEEKNNKKIYLKLRESSRLHILLNNATIQTIDRGDLFKKLQNMNIKTESNFMRWLKNKYPDESKWKDITKINYAGKDLIGVEKLINLETLYCSYDQLTDLDVSKNIKLKNFSCANNQLTELNLSNNINLEYLYCHHNELTKLDLTKNINLVFLYCNYNQLTELDVTKNINLINLYCHNNQLKELDVTKNIRLKNLYCRAGTKDIKIHTENDSIIRD